MEAIDFEAGRRRLLEERVGTASRFRVGIALQWGGSLDGAEGEVTAVEDQLALVDQALERLIGEVAARSDWGASSNGTTQGP